MDSTGAAISGFDYWAFAYPTLVTSGAGAVSSFVLATNGSSNFGGTVGTIAPHGTTFARWNDAANPNGWSAASTVFEPTPLPRGVVSSAFAANTFQMTLPGGVTAATVDVSTTPGSATLVYQVDRTNGVVTISPQDIAASAGLAALAKGLSVGANVRTAAVPNRTAPCELTSLLTLRAIFRNSQTEDLT